MPILDRLAEICRAAPTRRKILLLSNPAEGAALLERLSRRQAWANIIVRPPARYAEELSFLELSGTPFPTGAGAAIVSLLLAEKVTAKRLRALARFPGAAASLWNTLRDLRLAGLYSKDLEPGHFVSPERWQEARELLECYEQALKDNAWYDDADCLRMAAAKTTDDMLLVPEPARWSALERQFLSAAGPRVEKLSLYPEGGLSACAAKLDAFSAVSQEAEARAVIRRVLDDKTPLDQIELVLAGSEYDRSVYIELFGKLGIPFTLAMGHPIGTTGPGKALLGYLAWIESGFEAGRLERLLRSGALTLKDEGVSALAAARALARFSLYKGRAAFAKVLDSNVAEFQAEVKAHERDEEPELAERARSRLRDFNEVRAALLDLVKEASWADNDKLTLSDAVAGCAAFLSRFAPIRGELDTLSRVGIAEALDALTAAGNRTIDRAQACIMLRDAVLSTSPGAERGRPGKLHVTTLDAAGWEGRSLTYVAGLTLHNYPGRVFQDPFLLDEERQSLGRDLPLSDDLRRERAVRVAGRLAGLKGTAVFGTYTYDSAEARDTGPATLFLEMVRIARKEPEAGYKDLDRLLGTALGQGDALVDELSWWLAQTPLSKELEEAFPWAVAVKTAASARSGDTFTAHEGLVSAAAGAVDPTRGEKAISATFMADLAACPFRFFLKRVLGIAPKEDEERDPLVWLDARERGELLHDLYADFLRRHPDAPPGPAQAESLLALLDAKLDALKKLIPPATEALCEAERQELHQDALLFLRRTIEEWPQRRPVGREVAFGQEDNDGEKLSSPKPIEIELGGARFLIQGRVDRVDQVAANEYEVLDYKTGHLTDAKREQMEELPAAFQPAFYALAVEKLLRAQDPKAKVSAFSFLFSTRAGRWTLLKMGPEQIKLVEDEIGGLLELLRQGRFRQSLEKKECEKCHYAAACGDEPWERAKALHGDKP